MFFKYLRKPTPTDLLTSGESFQYYEYGMTWMGWRSIPMCQPIYGILSIFIFAWSVYYLPFGLLISCVLDIKNYSPSELLTVFQLFFDAVGTPFKVLFLRLHLWRVHKMKTLLNEMDKRCTSMEERYEVHRWVVRCNMAYLFFQSAYIGYTMSTFLSSAFSGVLPWRIYVPFLDWRKSKARFWITALHETFLMVFAVSQALITDFYAVLYGIMLRVHIRLLIKRVEKLCTDPDKSENENVEDLINCIKDHKLIQESAQVIRPVIARTIFVQFLLIGITLGLSMINLFFFADLWAGLATLVYMNGLIMQTFPFCFVCDQIKSDCELLENAIFHSDWVGSSRRYKSLLIFFLYNSQKSVEFTAGTIFPISTGTNIQVAKLAFSVVTFVNQLNIADRLTN
ncbi:odorant receptor 98a [Drosophila rhopaloa]|uniref:Odorant receptor n=1 Tax=Drosophila rhopaloa TaxID=1041015 RepID=A0A6P4E763_DRORH|nr:odorant receptor 98a [Drosophila rhopaloa]